MIYRESDTPDLQEARVLLEELEGGLHDASSQVEVVVADRNIFQWYNRDARVTQAVDATQPVTYHNIFAPTGYHLAFRDVTVRDAVNDALTTLKTSGRYDAVIEQYKSRP